VVQVLWLRVQATSMSHSVTYYAWVWLHRMDSPLGLPFHWYALIPAKFNSLVEFRLIVLAISEIFPDRFRIAARLAKSCVTRTMECQTAVEDIRGQSLPL
jgi:hypothetical protein